MDTLLRQRYRRYLRGRSVGVQSGDVRRFDHQPVSADARTEENRRLSVLVDIPLRPTQRNGPKTQRPICKHRRKKKETVARDRYVRWEYKKKRPLLEDADTAAGWQYVLFEM